MRFAICSICLRVQRGKTWIDAARVISETRSYELADIPRLMSAVCDDCVDEILRRRAERAPGLAA
jgi:hypothetical protein